jgi:hypothetical protein
MIDFNSEIAKYEPILETENMDKAVKEDGFDDIMDMLRDVSINKRGQ